MSRISVHKTSHQRHAARRGFTIVELVVACSLSAIVFAGILAAYIFIGRNLTRLVNTQQQEVESRRALHLFTADLSAARQLSTASTTAITLTKPTANSTTTVSYAYSAADGTLVRTDGAGAQTLLKGLTSLTITYYNEGGTVVTGSPQSIKAVELAYASTAGTSTSGTLARYTTVSPRVLLRNKQILE